MVCQIRRDTKCFSKLVFQTSPPQAVMLELAKHLARGVYGLLRDANPHRALGTRVAHDDSLPENRGSQVGLRWFHALPLFPHSFI
jgi:hypothetical protein